MQGGNKFYYIIRPDFKGLARYLRSKEADIIVFTQSEEDLGNLVVSDVLKLQDGERTTTWYSTYSKMPSTAW